MLFEEPLSLLSDIIEDKLLLLTVRHLIALESLFGLRDGVQSIFVVLAQTILPKSVVIAE